ncbi:hypothetical protein CC86DRAFT_374530 [Ophiobolus disseminans]|uniref:RING-type domain-containing protein n=1 Tax=Ophiobolus disseminans TaxID=1469910 RepID=A0A6A6ZHC9_9PLEO|nr:hypothetical protein CC86DRAFT_374530 [Ophiobolus disseminans]
MSSTLSETAPSRLQRYDLLYSSTTRAANDAECCICFDPCFASADQEGLQLRCKHTVHDDCLLDWSREKSCCPLCRAEMFLPAGKKYAVPFEFEGELVVSEQVLRELEKGNQGLVEGWREVGERWNTQGHFVALVVEWF